MKKDRVIDYLATQLANWMESEAAETGYGIVKVDPKELIREAYEATK